MHDYLHFGQLGALLRLLRPLARILGPWPFVVLTLIVLAFISFASFEFFDLAHDFLHTFLILFKAALAAFFYCALSSGPFFRTAGFHINQM